MKKFRSRLFSLDNQLPPNWIASGLGWTVSQRHFRMHQSAYTNEGLNPDPEKFYHMRTIIGSSYQQDGTMYSDLAPELIIESKTYARAQRILKLIVACYTLLEMNVILDEDAIAVPDDPSDYPRGLKEAMIQSLRRGYAAPGCFRGARIAANASRRLSYQHAVFKYFHGFNLAGTHWMDTHPTQGTSISVTNDPSVYTRLSLALTAFYSAIEEMNLHVIASTKMPSKLSNGQWNPPVLDNLKARLTAHGIDPNSTTVWIMRGTPTRIERHHRPPSGKPTSWARGTTRDCEIPIYEALGYASTLRSRVSAHRTSLRTRSLTVAHVSNVQMLARRLLLQVIADDYSLPALLKKGAQQS